MIISTTHSIEGKRVYEYIGIVTGTDVYTMGGSPKKCNEMLQTSMAKVVQQLSTNAENMGADAVIGVTFSVMEKFWLVATGTAVKLEG